MSVPERRRHSLMIVDDHQIFVDMLVMACNDKEFDFVNPTTARNGEEALEKLSKKKPDLLVLDLNMPVMNGLEALPLVRQMHPDLKILILTKYSDPKFVRECLQEREVNGYLLKTSPLSEFWLGIKNIRDGGGYMSKDLRLYPKNPGNEDVISPSPFEEEFLAKYNLTKREQEILSLISQAKNNAEIADYLYISPQTVGAHRKNIMRKLNITTTAGLVKFAIENQVN